MLLSVSLWSLPKQNWNYFADNEADSVKMMEEVEKLCDRLELTRYSQDLLVDSFEFGNDYLIE